MTNEEARKIRSAFNNGFEYPFGGGFVENCNMEEVNRHAEILDEAIERQIMKEPIDVQPSVITWGICPRCKGELSKLGNRPNRIFIGTRYCSDCGQAIDWSNYETEASAKTEKGEDNEM